MSNEAMKVYRVQAADGRGPWRPGLSRHWIDESSDRELPADILTAFGSLWRQEIPQTWYAGCGCRSMEALYKWFTPLEQARLSYMGYVPVVMTAERIVRENDDQVIFARKLPFTQGYLVVPWENLVVPWKEPA